MAWKIGESVATLANFPVPPTSFTWISPAVVGYNLNGVEITCGKPSVTMTFDLLSAADYKTFVDYYLTSTTKIFQAPKEDGLASVTFSGPAAGDPTGFEWQNFTGKMERPKIRRVRTGGGMKGVHEEVVLTFNQVEIAS